jgi:transposase
VQTLSLASTVSKSLTDLDGQALDALIARVTEAKENNLALSAQDSQLLLDALLTLASMQCRLTDHNVTIHKLRKLLGIEKSSEKQTDTSQKTKKYRTNKRTSASADEGFTPVKPTVVIHPITDIKKGDNCPECLTGNTQRNKKRWNLGCILLSSKSEKY